MTKFKWHLLLTPEVSTEQLRGIISCETCSIWQVTTLTSQVCLPCGCLGQSLESHQDVIWFSLVSSHLQTQFSFWKKIRWLFISLQCKGCPSDHVDVQSSLSDLGCRQQCPRGKAELCLPAEATLHTNAYKGYQLWLQPELLVEDRNATRALWDCRVPCSVYPEMPLLV